MDSILTTIKKMLGIEAEYTHFDTDIVVNINSTLMGLTQIGVGPTTGFFITGDTETWSGLLGERTDMEAVKSYIYMKVRLLFDPPSSSFVIESIQRQIAELEWRLNANAEKEV